MLCIERPPLKKEIQKSADLFKFRRASQVHPAHETSWEWSCLLRASKETWALRGWFPSSTAGTAFLAGNSTLSLVFSSHRNPGAPSNCSWLLIYSSLHNGTNRIIILLLPTALSSPTEHLWTDIFFFLFNIFVASWAILGLQAQR